MNTMISRQDVDESPIKENIAKIIEVIKSKLDNNIESIFLSGGLSRGEGSARMTKKGILQLLGDYDVVCVTKHRVFFPKRLKLPKGIPMGFNTANAPVDVGIIPKQKLNKLNKGIEYIDWKNSAKIIYGNKKIFDTLSFKTDYNKQHLNSIILNRFKYLADKLKELEGNWDPYDFGHFLIKAIEGIVNVKLIQKNKYETMSKLKLKNLEEIDTNFSKKYKTAMKYKKFPERFKKYDEFFEDIKFQLLEMLTELNMGSNYKESIQIALNTQKRNNQLLEKIELVLQTQIDSKGNLLKK